MAYPWGASPSTLQQFIDIATQAGFPIQLSKTELSGELDVIERADQPTLFVILPPGVGRPDHLIGTLEIRHFCDELQIPLRTYGFKF